MESLKLHDTISFYRKKQNLTQEALAQKLGVTNQSVSKWESAQCYPDISLIPQLAEIFEITIDELFGKEPAISGLNDVFSLCDDDFRVIVVKGNTVLDCTDIHQTIDIQFPKNCNETTRQYFKVEVLGNICCDGSINGDVVSRGNIECNQINGDIKCSEGSSIHIKCHTISGDIRCFGNIECEQINGDATSFYSDLTCRGNISGDARTFHGGNIICGSIGGDAACEGDTVQK